MRPGVPADLKDLDDLGLWNVLRNIHWLRLVHTPDLGVRQARDTMRY